ncbi:unnamed protein product [Trichogramma brassicae]|uniref:Uncharacterized protein n=1 Tax=Trichogramma brassicae TaxID=86971 RepID=A0A6H5IUD8_9HYME|nr:unnamed protein product [Trichogramma brassicae]
MAPMVAATFHNFYWSTCSRKEFQRRAKLWTCLDNQPEIFDENHPQVKPSNEVFGMDEQCRMEFGDGTTLRSTLTLSLMNSQFQLSARVHAYFRHFMGFQLQQVQELGVDESVLSSVVRPGQQYHAGLQDEEGTASRGHDLRRKQGKSRHRPRASEKERISRGFNFDELCIALVAVVRKRVVRADRSSEIRSEAAASSGLRREHLELLERVLEDLRCGGAAQTSALRCRVSTCFRYKSLHQVYSACVRPESLTSDCLAGNVSCKNAREFRICRDLPECEDQVDLRARQCLRFVDNVADSTKRAAIIKLVIRAAATPGFLTYRSRPLRAADSSATTKTRAKYSTPA